MKDACVSRSRPTILQIVPRLDTGGAELSTIEIADAVTRAGGLALIATAGGRMLDRLAATGAELINMPVDSKNPFTIAANARRLARIAVQREVDILHARSRAPAWSALAAARRTGRKFVTTYHGAYGERGRAKRLYNSVMARGDIVIANSQFTADLIRERYATPPDRIRVIHRGVDETLFSGAAISAERKDDLRRRWGVPSDQRIILQAARLTAWKGQDVLVEAAGRLHAAGRLDDVSIVLAGDDQGRVEYRRQLEDRIAAAGLADKVLLVGHVDDIAAAFAMSHVAVIASIEPEAFGRTAIEAQVLGCPVVATRLGAPQETVITNSGTAPDGRTGWLVPPGDANALASALLETLSLGDDERSRIGARAIEHVISRFSLRRMKRDTLAVYDFLLGSKLAEQFER